jgi:hypothetical protein
VIARLVVWSEDGGLAPCVCSLKIWKVFVLTLSFQAKLIV